MADFGEEEREAVNRVLGSHWLASGKENTAFEEEFAGYVGAKHAVCCNSGSSANLLALASLNLSKGSKVLSSACGFPATLSPILHLGMIPVLVDYDIRTFNINIDDALRKAKDCKAIILAHTLGNPVDINLLKDKLEWINPSIRIIEDCCEAVGGAYKGRKLGTVGDLGTFSFYPAHQITAEGAGGMVVTNDRELYRTMKSMRDWGKMFDWDSGFGGNTTDYSSPIEYHRGYTYDTLGWNFKLQETSCAFGREQLKKLDRFKSIRQYNWDYLNENLSELGWLKIAPMSEDACPFGFCMTVESDRNKFGMFLEKKGIKHRPFFAGNILRHKAFASLPEYASNFSVADFLMKHALFIGCHSKLTQNDLNYIVKVIRCYPLES